MITATCNAHDGEMCPEGATLALRLDELHRLHSAAAKYLTDRETATQIRGQIQLLHAEFNEHLDRCEAA